MEPPAAMTTTGIYCKTCGYDLRASGEAKRCPECGRAFSPDAPKTFRPRPFAAPWQRAVARWAKRGAMLLLVLVVLLAGVWGWFCWGWTQERAAVAEARGQWSGWGRRNLWDGTPGRWLHDYVPGSFVMERIRFVSLSKTATDAGLLPLPKLRRLTFLVLTGSQVSDAGLIHLEKITGLRRIVLTGTKVTPAGVARLKAALPGCEIEGP